MDPLAHRVLARYLKTATSSEELINSINGLIKFKGGQFASERQAKFLWHAAKTGDHPSFLHSWASKYHTGENSYATILIAMDRRFGHIDPSKIRYYAYAYVLDGAGVVASARVKLQHPKAGENSEPIPVGIEETFFERKEPAQHLYDASAEERAHAEKVKGNSAMIEQIKSLPEYENKDILQSFVQQLEEGKLLSPAQLGVLRKFMPVEVGNVQEWIKMRDESFHLTEEKLIHTALRFLSERAKEPGKQETSDWYFNDIKTHWDQFKSHPEINHDIYDSGSIRPLAEFGGWRRIQGVTGYLDILARMCQLVKAGNKAPKSVLKLMRILQEYHSWIKSLSPSKVEQGLKKFFGQED